jgi:RNA-binding protein NOB1
MDGSWYTPDAKNENLSSSTPSKTQTLKEEIKLDNGNHNDMNINEDDKYYALVVDSGAIIKHSGFSTLHNAAKKYFTTQGVYDEIKDSKARIHLESLPFQLEIRKPSGEGITKMIEFSKKTGDYRSLSNVDIQVLGLLYDLEKEGCNSMSHIRTEPKHILGGGKVTPLNKSNSSSAPSTDAQNGVASETATSETKEILLRDEEGGTFVTNEIEVEYSDEEDDDRDDDGETDNDSKSNASNEPEVQINTENQHDTKPVPKTWAMMVNPKIAATATSTSKSNEKTLNSDLTANLASITLSPSSSHRVTSSGGQFSDADEDDESDENNPAQYESSSDDDDDEGLRYANAGTDYEFSSDEECDVYILDPEEVEERKRLREEMNSDVQEELELDFPSLSVAMNHAREVIEEEDEKERIQTQIKQRYEEDEKRKAESLKPISKSGKLYKTLGNFKSSGPSSAINTETKDFFEEEKVQKSAQSKFENKNTTKNIQSRVIGGISMSGQGDDVEDDGEGWVTSTKDIFSMKATGRLDPWKTYNISNPTTQPQTNNANEVQEKSNKETKANIPEKNMRTACATTDFAMQNVILQMHFELLPVDGVKVRKLKSWVTRCAACFTVYTGENNNDMKRLFCGRCGSDALQRIAASVDGKTGRLRLHMSKKYKNNTRGTQFHLPKPGKGNRFKGDLLLREDQLLYGAWNQRLKQSKSNKEAESLFGSDIAYTVGLRSDLTKRDDIRVGFGKKNPNSSKFGRERRGKKKKGAESKACGLRRY